MQYVGSKKITYELFTKILEDNKITYEEYHYGFSPHDQEQLAFALNGDLNLGVGEYLDLSTETVRKEPVVPEFETKSYKFKKGFYRIFSYRNKYQKMLKNEQEVKAAAIKAEQEKAEAAHPDLVAEKNVLYNSLKELELKYSLYSKWDNYDYDDTKKYIIKNFAPQNQDLYRDEYAIKEMCSDEEGKQLVESLDYLMNKLYAIKKSSFNEKKYLEEEQKNLEQLEKIQNIPEDEQYKKDLTIHIEEVIEHINRDKLMEQDLRDIVGNTIDRLTDVIFRLRAKNCDSIINNFNTIKNRLIEIEKEIYGCECKYVGIGKSDMEKIDETGFSIIFSP